MCTCRTALTAMSLGMLILLCAPATHAQLQSGTAQTVTGQVSAVEGEFHMAKDFRGEDILKMVDKSYIVTTPTERTCAGEARGSNRSQDYGEGPDSVSPTDRGCGRHSMNLGRMRQG